jgi:signal transduction histidine kinase
MAHREQATINGDSALLQRLVSNLLDNAIKFADRNTVVTIDLAIEAQRLALGIHNRGPAIDPQLLPHVFERFFQVDSARSSGGSGLGLSICKWIVDAHAGEIAMQSDAEGTRVKVLLPLLTSESGMQNRE